MTVEDRAKGWLTPAHHSRVRELLCHALVRYDLICPAYCLMPDHGHFLWIGIADESDQACAATLFRRAWNVELRSLSRELQRQGFDHVLTERERERGAFAAIAHYIFENPVRAGIVPNWREYRFLGSVVPGYPQFDPRDADFWERFWRVYEKLSTCRESLTASATKNSVSNDT